MSHYDCKDCHASPGEPHAADCSRTTQEIPMTDETHTPKHTPGPWRVVYYDCGGCEYYDHNGPCPSIQAPDDQDCAIVHWDGFKQKYWSSANGNQRQIEANAHLIAAAPDLLEALREARDQLWHLAKDPNNNPLLCQIDAAIAKAEGRS